MTEREYVHWDVAADEKGIVWLGMDRANASVNTLGAPVLEELERVLTLLARETPRAVVVYSRKEGGFAAGADAREFARIEDESRAYELVRKGQQVLDQLASLPCASVAMIHGYALGGGLELALACRYRIVSDTPATRLGFPEVRLGIHPGFGGTVRAVSTIGVSRAMDLMLTGRTLGAHAALACGLVDRACAPPDLRERATNLALTAPPVRRPGPIERLLSTPLVRPWIARTLRSRVARRARREQYPAPYAIIELWDRHGGRMRPESFEAEARSISRLMCGATARNLVRVFFLRERLKSLGKESRLKPRRVHVVGAGTMGGDIAAWCALRGMAVTLQDREARFVQPALVRAAELFDRQLADEPQRLDARARLRMDLAGDAIADADIVIEAVFEDPELKAALFRSIEPRLGEQAILATNTSSIPLETLARSLREPGRLVGMHFFNPVSRMPLVEIVSGPATRSETVDRALATAHALGKLPLPVRSSPGFLVNRVLAPYLAAALAAWEAGFALEAIDRAAENFGMPMGPAELADTIGLDVALSVARTLGEVLPLPPPPQRLRTLVERGQLGRKSGRGLYVWHQGRPQKHRYRTSSTDEPLQDRLVLPLLNEAVRCLREGVVADEDLLDAGVIFGTGFAPFRGGPIHYARATGAARLQAGLRDLANSLGPLYAPHPGWDSLLINPVVRS